MSHVPLGRLFTVGDIEAEQELSKQVAPALAGEGTAQDLIKKAADAIRADIAAAG